MVYEHVPPLEIGYALGVLAVGGLSAAIARYAWGRRDAAGGTSLAVLMTGVTFWNVSKGIQALTESRLVAYVTEMVLLVGVGLVVAAFATLVLELTGRSHLLTRRTVPLLAIEPVLLVAIAATNGWHQLLWTGIETRPEESLTVVFHVGPAFWLHTAYSYGLLTVAIGLLVQQLLASTGIYRRQAMLVLVATIAPILGNALTLSGHTHLDLAPLGFAVTGIAITWAITQDRLIDLSPIARETVVETLPDPVFVLDNSGRLTDVNDAGLKLLDAPKDHLIGEAFEDVLQQFAGLEKGTAAELESIEELELTTPRGVRVFEVRATPLVDPRGERLGRLFRFHDVTELYANRRDLEAQNEQLERFASVVSHDLRNPLSVAEGYIELARESGDEEHFEAVEESLERMNAIIEDVLTMAQEGSQIDERQAVSLAAVARTAWEQVDTGSATLEIEDDVTIPADPSRLQRLFENLIRNAVEHGTGDDAGRDLTVTVGPIAPEDGASVRDATAFGFYVADDGVGVPAGDRESVLEPGNSTAEGGTGLGLSIVQGIARAHGWSVSVTESATGGARFEFTGAAPVSHPASLDVGRGAEP